MENEHRTINNPWLAFTPEILERREGILEIDRPAIDRFNTDVKEEKFRVQVQSLPEPFIGNPATARVVLLGLNPGHSEQDALDYAMPAFRSAILANLHHAQQEFPFYPLNPSFEGSGAGSWWLKYTARLRSDSGLDVATFAERLMVIEWFPYHSRRYKRLSRPVICPSQAYSFELARRLHGQGKTFVMLRSRKLWESMDRVFVDVPGLNSPQRAWLTPGNMPAGVYDRVLDALTSKGGTSKLCGSKRTAA